MRNPVSIAAVVYELERHNLLPAIVFRSARAQCDQDAERAGTNRSLHLPPLKQRELHQRVHQIAASYEMDLELITTHPQYNALITSGVGAHHAGQLLMWRLLLEELMASGLLRVLVATGTVAAGVDFPARTVVITAHSRRGAEGFNSLTSAEFQQMSGRAGRRGKDTVGFCVAAPSPFCDARTLLRISKRPPEPLQSAYFPSPSTVLNLLRYRTVDGLQYTVERSLSAYGDSLAAERLLEEAQGILAEFSPGLSGRLDVGEDDGESLYLSLSKQQKKSYKRARRLRRQAEELKGKQRTMLEQSLTGLRELGYLDGDNLSPKGFWASNLCTSLVLELGEIIESGMFDGISLRNLAAIIASISGDEHRVYLKAKEPALDEETVAKLEEILERISRYPMPGVLENRKVLLDAAYTVQCWLAAEDWQQYRGILVLSGVAEGDAARLITQTSEHLNQLCRLHQSHHELSLLAGETKLRVLRPPLTEVMNLD